MAKSTLDTSPTTGKRMLTHLDIMSKTCPEGQRYIDIIDHLGGGERGFGIRVWAGKDKGNHTVYRKNFFYKFFLDGKSKMMMLGEFPSKYTEAKETGRTTLEGAREKFREARKLVKKGIDPREPKIVAVPEQTLESESDVTPAALEPEQYTVRQVLDNFYSMRARQLNYSPTSLQNDKYTIEAGIPETWMDRPADDIRQSDAESLIGRYLETTDESEVKKPGQARNLLKAVRSAWTYAMTKRMVKENIFKGINLKHTMPEVIPRKRERNLTSKEILVVWNGLSAPPGSESVRRAMKLILLTAQRPGEVASMHRDEIDGRWWAIPTERTKYKVGPYRVYLNDLALEVIGEQDGYIFPSPANDGHPIDRGSISKHLNRDRASNDEWAMSRHYGLIDWHPQDLRRTCRTMLPELGVIDEYAEEILNHQKEGLVATYNIYKYDDQKIEAMERWQQRLLEIFGSGQADDPPLPSNLRVLDDSEILIVWNSLNNPRADSTCRALKFMLLTGQALSRCIALKSEEIIQYSGFRWWQAAGRASKVFLTPTALQLIGTNENGYVFPSRAPGNHIDIGTISYLVLRKNCFGIPKWTPVDLQYTVAKKIEALGADRRIIAGLESDQAVNEWELKHWLERWEAALTNLLKVTDEKSIIDIYSDS